MGMFPSMQLRQYLKDKNLTAEKFGVLAGVSKHAVGKWCRGERFPRPEVMSKIIEVTEGAVGPEDFYDAAPRPARLQPVKRKGLKPSPSKKIRPRKSAPGKKAPRGPVDQARILSEALPFMMRNAGQTIVIKYGGHAMGDKNLAAQFAHDLVLLRQVRINPVVVHGGGPQIGDMLDKLKIKSRFIDGLRITDAETVDVVEMVLAGTINKQIVSAINLAGGFAVGLSGKDGNLIRAEKLRRTKRDPESNIERILDLGMVGEPSRIDPHILNFFEESDITPVIAPIGMGPNGETLNINADTVAGAIAQAVAARRLMILTDVNGVRDSDGRLISRLTAGEARSLIEDGTIEGGMIPKVETCLAAIENGVEGAVIIDGRVPHALLVELFTEHGAGTLIEPG